MAIAKDGRGERRSKVVSFISRVDLDRKNNLDKLEQLARKLVTQLPGASWDAHTWEVTSGPLLRKAGRNVLSVTIAFGGSPKIGAKPLCGDYVRTAKSLVVLRYHRKGQSIENQRTFVHAVAYVQKAAGSLDLAALTVGHLDQACDEIASSYSEGTAYNLHKAVGEFSAHLDANRLGKQIFDYKYSKQRRPDATGGLEIRRLDDPVVLEADSDKMASPAVYRLIGTLFLNVPSEHRARIHVLVLSALACAGRRFSEVETLPRDCVKRSPAGETALSYFPRKASHGNVFTPKREFWLPTDMVEIVTSVVKELKELSREASKVAKKVRALRGPDLSFLNSTKKERYYKIDLIELGLPAGAFDWLVKSDLTTVEDKQNVTGRSRRYTNRAGIESYCRRDYYEELTTAVHIDQFGNSLYLDDLLICQFMYLGGAGGNTRAWWLANGYSHVMLDKFIERQLPALAAEYAPEVAAEIDFTSHAFRHTVNTLLDEGGLPELLQTDWFGRKNPRDTKAYQHTSREKRVLEVRKALLEGNARGRLSENLKKIPIELKETYVNARVNAVHDVGPGVCVHDFGQLPCERHLQCTADCEELVWASNDEGRVEEIKRQWAVTKVARKAAEERSMSDRPRRSDVWISHNDKKLQTLEKMLMDNGIPVFDPDSYLAMKSDGKT